MWKQFAIYVIGSIILIALSILDIVGDFPNLFKIFFIFISSITIFYAGFCVGIQLNKKRNNEIILEHIKRIIFNVMEAQEKESQEFFKRFIEQQDDMPKRVIH